MTLDTSGVLETKSAQIVNNTTGSCVAHWSTSGTSTGAIKVTIPGTHSSNWSMLILRVAVYEYNGNEHTIFYVSGHDWTSGWYNKGVTKWGDSDKEISVAYDSNDDYIIIGDVSSTWSYGHVTVDVVAHPSFYHSAMDITSGWAISQVTSLSGITVQAVTNKLVADRAWVNAQGFLTSSSTQSKYLRSDANDTGTGIITLSQSNSTTPYPLIVKNVSNGNGVGIEFDDNLNGTQRGYISHFHSDTKSYGSGASMIISSSESTTTILADGKLMYKEGIYSKPSSGTGAGSRKDNLWDEAYNNHITGIAVTGTGTKTITLTQKDGGTISANFTDQSGSGGITMSGGVNDRLLTATSASAIQGEANLQYNGAYLKMLNGVDMLGYNSSGGNFQLRSENPRRYGMNSYETGITALTTENRSDYITGNSRAVTALVLGNTPFGAGTASSNYDMFNITRVNQAAYGPSSGQGSFSKVLNLRGNGDLYLGPNSSVGAVYATKYYDKASTGYYLDPGSSSVALHINGIIDQDFSTGDLNAAWTTPGNSFDQGFIVGRYSGTAANRPHHNDNANWFANIYSHSTGGTASYGLQLAGSNANSGENSLSLRTVSNGSFSSWRKVFHEGHPPTAAEVGASASNHNHDGTYVKIGATHSLGSVTRFLSNNVIDTTSGSQSPLEIYQDNAGHDAFMTFHISGDYAAYFGLDGASNDFVFGGWSKGAVKQRIFHDGYHPNADGLTTSRTFTIGNTGKLFDGTGNVSWTLAEIGAQAAGSYAASSHTHSAGDITSGTFSNRFSTGTRYSIGLTDGSTSQTRDKIRVWGGGTYTIGMKSGFSYGHLNDYAMSFQMNSDNDRGWWWGDSSHTDAQGAMSLTTNGRLVVATSLSVGQGESVTSPSTEALYVSGLVLMYQQML